MMDDALSSDICEALDCGEEAFRHCPAGCGWRCTLHPCFHMGDIDSKGWLSNEAIAAGMTDAELLTARTRLALQLYAIDGEIQKRRFETWRSKRPPSAKAKQRKMPDVSLRKSPIGDLLNRLTVSQLIELERKLRGDKKP